MTIPVLIGIVFVKRGGGSFYERISLNSVLLLVLVNFVSRFRLELMYISLIMSIRSNLTHLHVFQFSESNVKFRQTNNYCKKGFRSC